MGTRGRIQTPLATFSGSDRYRWHVLGAVLIGAFMSALDASIVNIALRTVTVTYHSRLGVVEWVPLSYLLTLVMAMIFVAMAAAVLSVLKERQELAGHKHLEAPLEF